MALDEATSTTGKQFEELKRWFGLFASVGPDEKVCIRTRTVVSARSWYGALFRYWNAERRSDMVTKLQELLETTQELYPRLDMGSLLELQTHLGRLQAGLKQLMDTYREDESITQDLCELALSFHQVAKEVAEASAARNRPAYRKRSRSCPGPNSRPVDPKKIHGVSPPFGRDPAQRSVAAVSSQRLSPVTIEQPQPNERMVRSAERCASSSPMAECTRPMTRWNGPYGISLMRDVPLCSCGSGLRRNFTVPIGLGLLPFLFNRRLEPPG